MKFRPCIDIHNGKVKQIVGSSLRDEGDLAKENYIAEKSAAEYAALFCKDHLTGGHVILLNGPASPHYQATAEEAAAALAAYPGGLQVGGGINADNASVWIERGASHVIVTSYVFREGRIDFGNLRKLTAAVGRGHVVLDLSCRRRTEIFSEETDSAYYICTDRWQTFTDVPLSPSLFRELMQYCDEFLVHGIAVEGKGSGIDVGLMRVLAAAADESGAVITYAGGIRSMEDIALIGEMGKGLIDYTVGSALDLYGGTLPYAKIAAPFTST